MSKKENLSKEDLEKKIKLEQEFQKKLAELKKRDPFVYKNF
tara:strand:- start:279 stop:401 length:123 start_codon:yes stop_codon:yes gene_type:complete